MSEPEFHRFTAAKAGRADAVLRHHLPNVSRNRLQQLIEGGHLRVNGATVAESSRKIKPEDRLELHIPASLPATLEAEAIPLAIVYEDADLLVIDKPAGLTVHPAPGHAGGTLVNALLAHCGDSLSGIGGIERPGIVHRLDKDTSGLMVVAKHDRAHRALSAQLADRTLGRVYQAFAWGRPALASGEITTQIGRSPRDRKKMAVLKSGGREATTRYRLLATYAPRDRDGMFPRALACHLECRLATGRTHQIRVHMVHLGMPLIGDPVYGPRSAQKLGPYRSLLAEGAVDGLQAFYRQALHAGEITFQHPVLDQTMTFSASLPADLIQLQSILSAL